MSGVAGCGRSPNVMTIKRGFTNLTQPLSHLKLRYKGMCSIPSIFQTKRKPTWLIIWLSNLRKTKN